MSTIHIACGVTPSYLLPLAVMLDSLKTHLKENSNLVVHLLHLKRIMVNYLRAGRGCRLRVATPFAAAVLVFIWSIGESLGAILPRRWLLAHSWKTEVKPVSEETIMQSNATQARLCKSPELADSWTQ